MRACVDSGVTVGCRIEIVFDFLEENAFAKFFLKQIKDVPRLVSKQSMIMSPEGELCNGILVKKTELPPDIPCRKVKLYYGSHVTSKERVMTPPRMFCEMPSVQKP